ncbi:hypothetical protein [Streptomyces sp. NPDC004286]
MAERPVFQRQHAPEYWLARNQMVAERLWHDARFSEQHGPDAPT